MNEYINLTLDNLNSEHLCCAIGDKKHEKGVQLKKAWLKERIKEGHTFRKLNVKGKVFIEFAPLEKAWVPIEGNNYNYIYCLWVAGSFKSKGYGKELLEYAIETTKNQGRKGICIVSSSKKKPFLAEKKFFQEYGFKVVDLIEDYELLALSFNDDLPSFNSVVKRMKISNNTPTIYYSNQCPFIANCIQEISEYDKDKKLNVNFELIDSLEKAKKVPGVFNNWAIFKKQKYVSHILLNKNSYIKLIEQKEEKK